jgi:hypothetical protein
MMVQGVLAMRKYLILAAALAIAAAAAVKVPAQAQSYYGPGMMGGGYGPGYGMMNGYGPGTMMGPGYGGGNGYGPGMMYGYGPDGRGYDRGQAYRGKRLCWHQTGAERNQGYYEACQN